MRQTHILAHTRVASLDVLRALAILLVFLSHYGIFGSKTLFQSVGQYGWAGVDLFFVLSGYLITSQLVKSLAVGQPPSYREFYFRRALRILPSYWMVLLLYWTIPHWREREVMAPFWKFLTFTTNFGLDFKNAGAFSHSWSLCVEEHFYLLLPLLVGLFIRFQAKKWVVPFFAAVFMAGLALRAGSWLHFLLPIQNEPHRAFWYITYFKRIYYPSYNRLDGLLAGAGISLIREFRPEFWRRLTAYGNLISVLGTLCLAGACALCYDETSFAASVFGYPLIALGFASWVIAALSPKALFSRIRVPGAATMARLSYVFYLIHKEMIHLIHARASAMGWNHDGILLFFLTFAVSWAVSVVLHQWIERPFLVLRDQLTQKASLLPQGLSEVGFQIR